MPKHKPTKDMIAWALFCLCFNLWDMSDKVYEDCFSTGFIKEGRGGYDPNQMCFDILYESLILK